MTPTPEAVSATLVGRHAPHSEDSDIYVSSEWKARRDAPRVSTGLLVCDSVESAVETAAVYEAACLWW